MAGVRVLAEHLGPVHADVLELHAAGVGEPLADVVPVSEIAAALAAAGDRHELKAPLEHREHRELVADARAAGEGAVAVQQEVVTVAGQHEIGSAARVLDTAPEEALLAVAAREGVGLLGRAEELRHPGLGEVVADQVGDRRVAARDAAGDLVGLGQVEPAAAVPDGLLNLQQVVLAQQRDLVAGGAVGAVALGGGGAQLVGHPVGDGQHLGHRLRGGAGRARSGGALQQGGARAALGVRGHRFSSDRVTV